MGFSIKKNYSVLNNYNYEGKSFLFSSLDRLSTPCRRILGGRNVCVLSQTYSNQMSTASKVTTAFFSVLIFPIAIVSIASLTIKLATLPWIWEKKKVKIQSKQVWNVINQFNNAFQRNEDDKAIQIFNQSPEVRKRDDVYDVFFKIINRKINNQSSWEEIQTLLPFLNSNDAIILINHAVKMKLSHEIKNNCHLTSSSNIINFIKKSLKYNGIENLERCYKELFSDALQIDVTENIILSAIKMDIADHMIRSLIKIKTSRAQNDLDLARIKLAEKLLRFSLFKKEQNHLHFLSIFTSIDSMKKIGAIIKNIRDINQIGCQSLNEFSVLSTQHNTNEQEQWETIRSEFTKFRDNLNKLTVSATDKDEENCIRSRGRGGDITNRS